MTIQQINTFRDQAKAMGKSDAQIDAYIKSKLHEPPNTPFTPRTDTPMQPQAQKSVGGFLKNIVKSGVDLVGDTVSAVVHPVETGTSLGKLGIGTVEKVIPGQQKDEQSFDALVQFYKNRYGSFDKLKETAYNDPVGFASDLATVAGGVGSATSAISKIGKAGKLGKVAKVASTINKFTDPLQSVTATPKALVPKSIISATAQKLYQSALKPSTTLSATERTDLLLTGLREGLPVTSKAYEVLGQRIDQLNSSIGKLIDDSAKAGDSVSRAEIVTRLNDVRKTVGQSVDPLPLLKELDGLEKRFLIGPDAIPVDKAQLMKVGTYRVLRKAYGEMKSTSIEGQKALARGIKEELGKKYPQLKFLNEKEAKLIKLDDALERAVGRISNRDIVSLGTTVAATANPLAGVLKLVVDNPYVKSKLAIALQKVADRAPKTTRIRRVLVPATRLTQPEREAK